MVQNTSKLNDSERILALETEINVLQQRVKQREEALTVLNRRLLILERGAAEHALVLEGELERLREHARATETELERLHQTKLFRWAAPFRQAYAETRREVGA